MSYAATTAPLSQAENPMFGLVRKKDVIAAVSAARREPMSAEDRRSMSAELLTEAQRLIKRIDGAQHPEGQAPSAQGRPFNHG